MIGMHVTHISLGKGIVTAYDEKYITVKFATKTLEFQYPTAFEKFLKAIDDSKQEHIINSINEAKAIAEQARLTELAAKKAKTEQIAIKAAAQKNSILSKSFELSHRIDGKRMLFYVFQGDTFDKEYNGGYIWAPVADKRGAKPHHWTRLLDVREGDIILHGCNGYVQAISVAKGNCYDCAQPVELTAENLWEREGRRIDCDYTYINKPIKTSTFTGDIIRLCMVKYAPFDKDGNGNMGYLFEINRELAKIFITESIKANPYLKDLDYITEIFSEGNNG